MYALKTPTLGTFYIVRGSYTQAKLAQMELINKFQDYTITIIRIK